MRLMEVKRAKADKECCCWGPCCAPPPGKARKVLRRSFRRVAAEYERRYNLKAEGVAYY
jgi:hypothetical protein